MKPLECKELRFGTSGLRDMVSNMTDRECYINTLGFLSYLEKEGGFSKGTEVALGGDLRPSTVRILRSVAKGVHDKGGKVDNQGFLPSPALALYGICKKIPSIMVTGSHIPVEMNGIKFNKASGEILKDDEEGILSAVKEERKKVYNNSSLFDSKGMFREFEDIAADRLVRACGRGDNATEDYIDRYINVFGSIDTGAKPRIFLYEQSSVGRDAAKNIFRGLGFDVICPVGLRSSDFISIDTESVASGTIDIFEKIMIENDIDIGITMDGDADRPLLVYRNYGNGEKLDSVDYVTGDILGLLTVLSLKDLGVEVDHVSVPVSSNDAIVTVLKKEDIDVELTKIGSPYCVASMIRSIDEHRDLYEKGKWNVCSWESNGGFLTSADMNIKGNILKSLPTRDAVLPLLSVIVNSLIKGVSIYKMVEDLPKRYTYADRKKDFSQDRSRAIINYFTPNVEADIEKIKKRVKEFFSGEFGFTEITDINYIDGVRIYFSNGDISHLRPSGNAPEFRNYAIASSKARAREIVETVLKTIIPMLDSRLSGNDASGVKYG